jgi:hypothetical protein
MPKRKSTTTSSRVDRGLKDYEYFGQVHSILPKHLLGRNIQEEKLNSDLALPYGKYLGKNQPLFQGKRRKRNGDTKENNVKDLKDEVVDTNDDAIQRPHIQEKGKMIFSKFDLASDPKALLKSGKGKSKKKLLEKLLQEQQKIEDLSSIDKEKAQNIQTQKEWDKALQKAQGSRVHDDPAILQKAIRIQERKKKASKKAWDGRISKQKQSNRPGFEGSKFGKRSHKK